MKIACPFCGKKKPAPYKGRRFQCNGCKAVFDATPNEGSDVFADPSRRLELQEEEARRKRLAARARRF